MRYLFATTKLKAGDRVVDAACGCGYGSHILRKTGCIVTGIDAELSATEYGDQHYPGPRYLHQRIEDFSGYFDAIVSFETLEHLPEPVFAFRNLKAPKLICSVPNQERFPFNPENFMGDKYPHVRHYTPDEFDRLIQNMGYVVEERHTQRNKVGQVDDGTDGLFLIYVCRAA